VAVTSDRIRWQTLMPAAFLIAGNVLGVGLLALPIKVGISGFLPSLLDILIISALMVVSAIVIASRLPIEKKVFDLPSFFQQELGVTGRWLAIVFNLILLYGILTAYLSGISSIIFSLLPFHLPRAVITVIYFLLAVSLIIFGREVLKRSSTTLMLLIAACFIVLIATGTKHFNPALLTYTHWQFLPIGLPVMISVFHFHNVIPTVTSLVNKNLRATKQAILIGVSIGVVINTIWVLVVLGTLAPDTIWQAMINGIPATIPMSELLNSRVFTFAALIFALLAVTASFVANGSGLFGFVKDLLVNFIHKRSQILAAIFAFLPPILITLIYPNIFLAAIDIVGGIAEAMLFGVLPGIILIRAARKKHSIILMTIGYILFIITGLIMLFVCFEKLGLINLVKQ
jgi:tyrosine-specific transport protein